MADWINLLTPAVVTSVVVFQFMTFATKNDLGKVEARMNVIERDYIKIIEKLAEISVKIDLIIGDRHNE